MKDLITIGIPAGFLAVVILGNRLPENWWGFIAAWAVSFVLVWLSHEMREER